MVLRVFALLLASNEVFIHCLDVFEATAVFYNDEALAACGIPELFKSRLSIPGCCYMFMTKLELSPLLLKP